MRAYTRTFDTPTQARDFHHSLVREGKTATLDGTKVTWESRAWTSTEDDSALLQGSNNNLKRPRND